MKLLITGGAGFIGQELVKQVYNRAERIVIYSRSESRQAEMKAIYPEYPDNKMRYFIGDVRDCTRLTEAMRGCDHVIHAAALKRVEVCEYDPVEAVETNVVGTLNVIRACNAAGVKKCIITSTDKAAAPETLYGGTKLCAERLFIAGNVYGSCRFSVCRYANVEGSTGSVLPVWERQVKSGEPITITDSRMTRMWISRSAAAEFVLSKFDVMLGGEIFVPQTKGVKIVDMAHDLYPEYPTVEIGIRPNEKLHEKLIAETDSRNCYFNGNYYTIYPAFHDWTKTITVTGEKVQENFTLESNNEA